MTTPTRQRRWRRLQTPTAISRLVFVVGALSVLSTFDPTVGARTRLVDEVVPQVFPAAATTGTAAIGVILIALSRALRRGKYRAWLLALVLSALAAVLHLVKGLDVAGTVLCLGAVALLASSRRHFAARPDPRSGRRTLLVLTGGTAIATVLGYGWLCWDPDGQLRGTTFGQRLAEAFVGLVGAPGPVHFHSAHAQERVAVGLVVLGAAVLLFAVLTAMEPAGGPHRLSPNESALLRDLLDRWGWMDSLGYFALRDDRSVIAEPKGRAAISYRVVGDVSLAGGDPIGDPAAWPDAIAAWLDEARSYGWTPAALGSSERGATAFHRAGLAVLELGDEAVVRTDEFRLSGRSMRGVRQAVARCERAGITVAVHRMADLDATDLATVVAKAEAWRDGPVERGFSMALGRFGAPADDAAVLVVASDETGEPIGLLHLVPWGPEGLSLDLMRRSRGGENGIVETMVAGLMAAAPDLGVERVSLNFAVFRSVFARGERLGAGPVLRLWRGALLWASRFWQIESLYRANAKYQPEWVPRFLVYRAVSELPKVATAALRAEAFLVRPSWLPTLPLPDRLRDGGDRLPLEVERLEERHGAVHQRADQERLDDRAGADLSAE